MILAGKYLIKHPKCIFYVLNHAYCDLGSRHLLKRCKHLKEILHRRLRHAELNRWHLKLAALRRGVVRHLYPDHI